MAPTIKYSLWGLISATPPHIGRDDLGSAGGPLAEADKLFTRVTLARRDEYEGHHQPDPAKGVLDPHDISNVGFFVLFALIGVAFVAVGIWFFFWAKNGGFHFKENDWDEYKSTVLRRKGPNGTLLSGATESTNLGGGSVYKDVVDTDNTTVITETTAMSGITAGPSDIGAREKRRKKQEMRERDRERRRRERNEEDRNRSRRHVGEEGVEDEDAEQAAKEQLRNYRHEKAARVGGLNKESEGSAWDGSTNPTESTMSSDLLSNRQSTPTSTPTKEGKGRGGGIRKVYSTADKVEAERMRKERRDARRRRDEHQQQALSSPSGSPSKTVRRDFSFQRSVVGTESAVTESLLESGSDLGTKSYHHSRPELKTQTQRQRERDERQREREERRARRGGYRRGRGDDEEDM